MTIHTTCDGVRRRDVIRVGALGCSSMTLAHWLRWTEAAPVRSARAKAAIFINLAGGPSHLDTFDLKPDAPDEYRGEFRPISTNVAGIQICEHLPKLAACADTFAILRGVTHSLAAHELGSQYVNTGNRPIPSLEFPAYGAVVTKELGGPEDLPLNVAIPRSPKNAGYLGVRYSAFATGTTPRPGQPYSVRGISLGQGLELTDVQRRQRLLQDLDRTFAAVERQSELVDGIDRFTEQAHTIITSPRARRAFDVSQETPSFAAPFGATPFGQSCLLAARLVESGVPFVTIDNGGWDTHTDNWSKLRDTLLPPFDEGLAALFKGLEQKGLLDSTTVFVTGEFGRTPKINRQRGGRDHFARCMFMLLGGGGVRGGQVIGGSDARGEAPTGPAYAPDDVAATFYHTLGIDPRTEYHTSTGRPVMIVRDGTVIRDLLG